MGCCGPSREELEFEKVAAAVELREEMRMRVAGIVPPVACGRTVWTDREQWKGILRTQDPETWPVRVAFR